MSDDEEMSVIHDVDKESIITKKRNAYMKGFQKEELVKFVEKNVEILFGPQYDGNIRKDQLWNEISLKLNSIGSNKTVDGWKKSFVSLKSSTKEKLRKHKDLGCAIRLSSVERQIIEMFGWEMPIALTPLTTHYYPVRLEDTSTTVIAGNSNKGSGCLSNSFMPRAKPTALKEKLKQNRLAKNSLKRASANASSILKLNDRAFEMKAVIGMDWRRLNDSSFSPVSRVITESEIVDVDLYSQTVPYCIEQVLLTCDDVEPPNLEERFDVLSTLSCEIPSTVNNVQPASLELNPVGPQRQVQKRPLVESARVRSTPTVNPNKQKVSKQPVLHESPAIGIEEHDNDSDYIQRDRVEPKKEVAKRSVVARDRVRSTPTVNAKAKKVTKQPVNSRVLQEIHGINVEENLANIPQKNTKRSSNIKESGGVNSTETTAVYANEIQREALVQLVDDNYDALYGRLSNSANGALIKKTVWELVTKRLNALGPKWNAKYWKRTFTRMKLSTKEKLKEIRLNDNRHKRTGVHVSGKIKLSALEAQITKMVGLEALDGSRKLDELGVGSYLHRAVESTSTSTSKPETNNSPAAQNSQRSTETHIDSGDEDCEVIDIDPSTSVLLPEADVQFIPSAAQNSRQSASQSDRRRVENSNDCYVDERDGIPENVFETDEENDRQRRPGSQSVIARTTTNGRYVQRRGVEIDNNRYADSLLLMPFEENNDDRPLVRRRYRLSMPLAVMASHSLERQNTTNDLLREILTELRRG